MNHKITEVVAALIWDGDKFMICQRSANKATGLLWPDNVPGTYAGAGESGNRNFPEIMAKCHSWQVYGKYQAAKCPCSMRQHSKCGFAFGQFQG